MFGRWRQHFQTAKASQPLHPLKCYSISSRMNKKYFGKICFITVFNTDDSPLPSSTQTTFQYHIQRRQADSLHYRIQHSHHYATKKMRWQNEVTIKNRSIIVQISHQTIKETQKFGKTQRITPLMTAIGIPSWCVEKIKSAKMKVWQLNITYQRNDPLKLHEILQDLLSTNYRKRVLRTIGMNLQSNPIVQYVFTLEISQISAY